MSQLKDYKKTFEDALGTKRYIAVSLTSTVASTAVGVVVWYTGLAPGFLTILLTVLVGFAFGSAYFGVHFLLYSNKIRKKLQLITDLEFRLDELSCYLENGNSNIFNANISNENQMTDWITRSQDWQNEVERYLTEHFGVRERNTFKHIVVLEYKVHGFNPLHTHHRNILAWKLLAIKEIILRYSNMTVKWRNSTV